MKVDAAAALDAAADALYTAASFLADGDQYKRMLDAAHAARWAASRERREEGQTKSGILAAWDHDRHTVPVEGCELCSRNVAILKRKAKMSLPATHHWIVANATIGPAKNPRIHDSQQSAEEEATLLARTYVADIFIIYEATRKVRAVDVELTRLDDEPPF